MNGKKTNVPRVLFVGIALMAVMAGSALGFGVTSPVWDTNPLVISPGQSTEITLSLQNMVGGNDFSFQARIDEGADLAAILDDDLLFDVPFGSDNVPVKVLITIPSDTPHQKTAVGINFLSVTKQESGKMIQLGGGVKTVLPIEIKTASEQASPESGQGTKYSALALLLYGLAGFGALLAIILMVLFILRIRRRNDPQL